MAHAPRERRSAPSHLVPLTHHGSQENCVNAFSIYRDRRAFFQAAGLVLALCVACPALATPVASRVALAGSDFIDWAQLGPDGSLSAPLVDVLSDGGAGATLMALNADNTRRVDQGLGWGGNFAPGDALVAHFTAAAVPAAFSLEFDTDVAAVGAQLQRSAFGAFLGHIGVFDGDGLLLETWSKPGFSNSAADDSAVFLGIERVQGDIRSVRFFMESLPGANNSFALNRIDFRTVADTTPNPVPEPGTLALALGVLGVLSLRVGYRAGPWSD
jgi:hypothetical protein